MQQVKIILYKEVRCDCQKYTSRFFDTSESRLKFESVICSDEG
jgi:hypothetical protein